MIESIKKYGQVSGYGIGLDIVYDFNNLDDFLGEVSEIELHMRQFSPFEFFAKELNDSDDPDKAWDVYENSILEGAEKVWREKVES